MLIGRMALRACIIHDLGDGILTIKPSIFPCMEIFPSYIYNCKFVLNFLITLTVAETISDGM